MPVQFLTDSEREALNNFPRVIPDKDISVYFSLSDTDKKEIKKQRNDPQNQLGFAVQLCSLRYMGFSPNNITDLPNEVLVYLAEQIQVNPKYLKGYGKRRNTRINHLSRIQKYLGFCRVGNRELNKLSKWLLNRALEHEKPKLLIYSASDYLHKNKIIRPRITTLERMVATSLNKANKIVFELLNPILTKEMYAFLDEILILNEKLEKTKLTWLRRRETTNSAKAILEMLKRLSFLKKIGVHNWDITEINPNRRKYLAQIARRATNQYLQRLNHERRYPILVAFLSQTFTDVIDELIDMFNQALWDCYQDSKKDLKEYQLSVAVERNEKLMLLKLIGDVILDPAVDDDMVRTTAFNLVPEVKLRKATMEISSIIKEGGDNPISFFGNRYSYIRQFSPLFLKAFDFKSQNKNESIIKAIKLLNSLEQNKENKFISKNSPSKFISKNWKPFIFNHKGDINKRYYELSLLWELRESILATNIWVEKSRKHAPLESYFIPIEKWNRMKGEICSMLGVPVNGKERLLARKNQLLTLIESINEILEIQNNDSGIRKEKQNIIVSPLKAKGIPESAEKLKKEIEKMLPKIDLADLIIEVDKWTGFSKSFVHESGSEKRTSGLQISLFASIMAQACNFGLHQMEDVSSISYRKLAWCSTWYIRDETLEAANTKIVNYQHGLSLAKQWGDGTLSSSDGQRLPVSVKTRTARPLPKYFGYGTGITYYTWTSDQLSQYGIKVLPATTRDAPFVLDGIWGNETELEIQEHTVDTAGQTEKIFGIFDIASILFSPRLKDIGTQSLYRFKGMNIKKYKNINFRFKGVIDEDLILNSWDEILRMVGSFRIGWVTASLVLQKFQNIPEKNHLSKALHEYGRLNKTIHILEWYKNETKRRKVNKQLNKGEAIHSLRVYIHHANKGNIKHRYYEEQQHQAACLNLVTNLVITWYTRYIKAAAEKLKSEGYPVNNDDLTYLWPTRFDNINVHGNIRFNVDNELNPHKLRPFRN